MFFKKKDKKIEHVTDSNIVITEIFHAKGETYQLFCDAAKSKGTMGQNTNFCLKKLTGNGWAFIIDNRQLCIEEVSLGDLHNTGAKPKVKQINEAFEQFKSFAEIL